MRGEPLSILLAIDKKQVIAAGHPPFLVTPAQDGATDPCMWIVADVTKANCIAFPDGMRGFFGEEAVAIRVAQKLNAEAA